MNCKLSQTDFEMIKRQNMLAIISQVLILLGALGVGVMLILSELLYPSIEEFSLCPPWYRAAMYVSLFVITIGIVGCAFFKNRRNTSKDEFHVALIIFLIGFSLSIGFALARNEAYWKDVVICIGGALCSVGLFSGIGSLIGLLKKLNGRFAKIYNNLVFAKPPKVKPIIMGNGLRCTLPKGATPSQIKKVESYFKTSLPIELVEFLLEFDGDGNLLFSARNIIETTESVRANFDSVFDGINTLCYFGGNGFGDYFCYEIDESGSIQAGKIYLWKHETNKAIEVAKSLPELIEKYYGGEIDE